MNVTRAETLFDVTPALYTLIMISFPVPPSARGFPAVDIWIKPVFVL
jgi:hypothetical protein